MLYHNRPANLRHASLAQDTGNKENQRDVINAFISSVLLGEGKNKNAIDDGECREVLSLGNQAPIVAEWLDGNTTTSDGSNEDRRSWIIVAVYPEVASRKLLQGVNSLLSSMMKRYALFYEHHKQQKKDEWNMNLYIPPSNSFDSAFHSILRRFLDELATNANNSLTSTEKRQKQKQSTTKKGKEKTVWHDGKGKVTKEALSQLDMSKDKDNTVLGASGGIREDKRAIAEAKAAYLPAEGEIPAWEEEVESLDELNIGCNIANTDEQGESDESQAKSGIRGFFSNLLSPNRSLSKTDLEPPLKQMQQLLTSKNVAPSTAQAICEVVEKQLLGKKIGTLTGVKRAVRHALEDAIERILRPESGGIGRRMGVRKGKSVDILRGVVDKRERGKGVLGLGGGGRPYVIVMIGINGVGKSTSLAKIAYYLQSNQCNPSIAACDTFRSGAVEQLSVHASCLNLPLFHQGYAKDPSAVAKAAILKASEDGNDVVLVDTAGRMQNNVPLMKALAKLVTETNPDLVLFVCEALVGNDGIDQLTMFQKGLISGGHSRPIDGIVLTKFDTVSDKVGAALTLTHLTGVPIAFCGTGQKYNHLKPLSVPYVVQSLFS